MTFFSCILAPQLCQGSSTLSSAAFSLCSPFGKCEPPDKEWRALFIWKNVCCITRSEESSTLTNNFHSTPESSSKKLNGHAKATSQMKWVLKPHLKSEESHQTFFHCYPRLGYMLISQFNYFWRGYSLLPFQPNKSQGWESSSWRKGSEFLLLFKKPIFFLCNVFFPLDENTEEAGVTEVTDLSKNVAKLIQNPNVTHQNKAFTYDILKTRLCVLLLYHVALPQNQEGYKHPE